MSSRFDDSLDGYSEGESCEVYDSATDCADPATGRRPQTSDMPQSHAESTEVADSGHSRAVERISALAKLSPLEYDRVRRTAATELRIRVETLDAEVVSRRTPSDAADGSLIFDEPEPWPEAVDGAELLDRIRTE